MILTTFDDDEYVFTGLRAGAKGYLLRDTPSEELVAAIEKASRGEAVLGGSITLKVISELRRPREPAADPQNPYVLSERELEVLGLIGSGASNREIARPSTSPRAPRRTTYPRSCANWACETAPKRTSTPPNTASRNGLEKSFQASGFRFIVPGLSS